MNAVKCSVVTFLGELRLYFGETYVTMDERQADELARLLRDAAKSVRKWKRANPEPNR